MPTRNRQVDDGGRLLLGSAEAADRKILLSAASSGALACWLKQEIRRRGLKLKDVAREVWPDERGHLEGKMNYYVADRPEGKARLAKDLRGYVALIKAIAVLTQTRAPQLAGAAWERLDAPDRSRLIALQPDSAGAASDDSARIARALAQISEQAAARLPLNQAAALFRLADRQHLGYRNGRLARFAEPEDALDASIPRATLLRTTGHPVLAPTRTLPPRDADDPDRAEGIVRRAPTPPGPDAELQVRMTFSHRVSLAIVPRDDTREPDGRLALLWEPITLLTPPVPRPRTPWGEPVVELDGWATGRMVVFEHKQTRYGALASADQLPVTLKPDCDAPGNAPGNAPEFGRLVRPVTPDAWLEVIASQQLLSRREIFETPEVTPDDLIGPPDTTGARLQALFFHAPDRDTPHLQLEHELWRRLTAIESYHAAMQHRLSDWVREAVDRMAGGPPNGGDGGGDHVGGARNGDAPPDGDGH